MVETLFTRRKLLIYLRISNYSIIIKGRYPWNGIAEVKGSIHLVATMFKRLSAVGFLRRLCFF